MQDPNDYETTGYGYKFMRLGEDDNDTETRENDWDIELWMIRRIDIPDGLEEVKEISVSLGGEIMELNNSKQIEENLKTVLTLEYLGIHIEDIKERDFKQLYYFSVPEKSTIETNDFLNDQIKTSDGLTQVAKDFLAVMIISSCKSEFDDSEEDEKFYEDVENNISDYALFFAKVRQGEVWDEEMGKTAVNKAVESLKNLSYKQI